MITYETITEWSNSFFRVPVAGLDISDLSVKYFAFDPKQAKGSERVSSFGQFQIPEGVLVKGEVQNEDELVRAFSAWRAQEKRISRSTFFAVSLPEEKSFLQIIQLPKIQKHEIKQAIRWEIEANIPLAFDDLVYDFEVLDPRGGLDHLDVVVTAFPKVIVDSYARVLRRAGLPLAALELESQAIARSVIADFSAPSAKIIADIGRTRTSFIVWAGGAAVFTTTIELGGQLFEEHLAKAFNSTQQEAQAMKVRVGLNKNERNGEVFDALIPTVAVLADELVRVVEYYRRHATHAHGTPQAIESILLVGGDASMYGLDTYLASALQLPVSCADPFIGVYPKKGFTVPPLRRNESLAYATVIGLALRGMR